MNFNTTPERHPGIDDFIDTEGRLYLKDYLKFMSDSDAPNSHEYAHSLTRLNRTIQAKQTAH